MTDKIFKHKDFSAYIDPCNGPTRKRINRLLSKSMQKLRRTQSEKTDEERYKKSAIITCDFFDNLFGKGSAYKILGDSPASDDFSNAIYAFVDYINSFNKRGG